MAKHSVADDGDPRKYYAAIPNIVFTLGLSPFELTLYVYLKKVAGESGACWMSTATIARECNMSVGVVSKLKASLSQGRSELGGKPLIVVSSEMQNGGNPNHGITITDIWPENMAALERVRQMKASRSSNEGARSRGEGARSPDERTRSRGGDKEELFKNNYLIKTHEEPSAHARLMEFHNSHLVGGIPDGGAQAGAVKWLLDRYTPEQCEEEYTALRSQNWRTTPVTWLTVKKNIGHDLGKNHQAKNGHSGTNEKILEDHGDWYTVEGPDGSPSNRYRTPEAFARATGRDVEEVKAKWN